MHARRRLPVRCRVPRDQVSTITLNAASVVMQSLVAGTVHLPVVGGGETPHITDGQSRG